MSEQFLKEVPIFMNLSEDDLQKIVSISKDLEIKKGDILFEENDPGDAFYIIKTGAVEIVKNIDGEQIVVSTLQAGDFFGEQALLEGKPRNATVRAAKKSELLYISKETFDTLLRSHMSISLKIMKVITSRLRKEHELLLSKISSEKPSVAKPQKTARIITFFSTKGGVGKSSLVANFGTHLAVTGKKTLIVDTDLQFGDISWIFNKINDPTMYELTQSTQEFDAKIVSDHLSKIDSYELYLLGAPAKPEEAETISKQQVIEIITAVRSDYDYILIDTASSFQDVSLAMLDISDFIVIAVTQDILSIKNAKLTLKLLKTLSFHDEKIKIAINMHSDVLQIRTENIVNSLDNDAVAIFPFTERMRNALNAGQPYYLYEPNSKYGKSFEALETLISGEMPQKPAEGMMDMFKSFYDSITKWKNVTEQHPEHSSAYLGLGLAYTKKGFIDNAIQEYKKAIELNPQYADAYYNLGCCYEKKGMYDDARTALEKALSINKNYKQAQFALGNVLVQMGKFEDAIKALESAASMKDKSLEDYPDYHNNLGRAYLEKGLYDKAIVEFEEALKLNPKYVESRFNMAELYIKTNEKKEAIAIYQKIIKDNLSTESVDLAKKKLVEIE